MRTSLLLAGLTLMASGLPAQNVPASARQKLYVVNQSGASISVIDQQRLVVDTVLDLTTMGFTKVAKPHHVVVEPDGSAWYVSLIGDGKVVKFDHRHRVLGQVAMETPGLLSLSPSGDSLFVGRSMTAPNPPRSLAVISRSDFKLLDQQEIMIARPHALVTTRDGRWTHTASLAENRFASVDATTGRVTLSTIAGDERSLVQFTISPDGKTMVAGAEISNSVLFFDLTKPPPYHVPAAEIPVAGKPWDPVFSPDGKFVYFTLFEGNEVAEIDVATRKETRRITAGLAQPYDLIMRADGKYLFVVNQNTGASGSGGSAHDHMPGMPGMAAMATKDGWLSVIEVATGHLVKTLPLGNGPSGAGAAGAR